jgi:hypothetical protein
MIILQRLTPVFAGLIAAALFGLVWLVPTSLYAAGAVSLLLYWLVVSRLPAAGVGERFQRWLVLALPLVSGCWLWILLDLPSVRQWLPIATVAMVLASGEVIFQAAYRRLYSPKTWLILVAILSAWFICASLALSNLLLNWGTTAVAAAAGIASLALLYQVVWIYSLPVDPWWAQLAWLFIYAQVFGALLLVPTTYRSQAAAGLAAIVVGIRLRLGQRVPQLAFASPWFVAAVGFIAIVVFLVL